MFVEIREMMVQARARSRYERLDVAAHKSSKASTSLAPPFEFLFYAVSASFLNTPYGETLPKRAHCFLVSRPRVPLAFKKAGRELDLGPPAKQLWVIRPDMDLQKKRTQHLNRHPTVTHFGV